MSRMIDADDLLTAFPIDDEPTVTIACIRATIKHMPIIEERKIGEWINVTNDESLEEEYECSVCGYELFYSNPTKFCPNCGADMRGGNHEAP